MVFLKAPSSPSSATCRVTPKEYASALNGSHPGLHLPPGLQTPWLPWMKLLSPLSNSGGRKPIVPHICMLSAEVTTFARPKSVSLAWSWSEIRMFSGFTSRNTIFSLRCKCANARPACPMYRAATCDCRPKDRPQSAFSQSSRFRSVGQSSRRSAKKRLKENAWTRCTMKGWSARCRARTSEAAWSGCRFKCSLRAYLRGSLRRIHRPLE
mmetsp:Transcript_78356/g.151330  ORF Transcript_78356/g.151330 Transcript_78356/m.151330 type:complete len:210 (+) Transcript_78356:390-1019(+)